MAKTLIDIDETLLADAMAATGQTTKKGAVTVALLEVVRAARARAYVEQIRAGLGRDLDDPDVVASAQR